MSASIITIMYHQDKLESDNLLTEDELKEMTIASTAERKEERLKDWVIYCKRRGKSRVNQQEQEEEKEYSKDLEEVGSFSTMRGFFSYYTSIKEPSTLEIDTKIFYFLKDCKPLWQQWLHTGCLLITIKFKDEQKDQLGARILNSTWQFLLFGLIGNNLPLSRDGKQHQKYEQEGRELIIGVILQRRQKISLIEVWYRNELHAPQLTRLLQQDINQHLKLKTKQQKSAISMKYKRHKDSIETNSTLKGGMNFKMGTIGTVSFHL